jgi:hypothetical protein
MPSRPFWCQLTYSPVAVDQTNVRCDVYAKSPKRSFELDGTTKDSLEKEIQQNLLALENQYKQHITSRDKIIGNGEVAPRRDCSDKAD